MEESNRNTNEIIMHVSSLFRFADPVFRLTTIGTVKLIQYFARMVREKKLSDMEFENFGEFLKVTDGKYDIMNIPAIDQEQLLNEMKALDIHYMVMPDLDKDDGLIQVAVYQPDREKFGAWYERHLISRMQGGEKELKELRSLTRGNVSIVSFPLEGREEGMQEDFQALGINYAKLPDLRVGDGSIQYEIANSDMGKVNQWYKLKQRDMLNEGEELPPIETITMEQYRQTGVMSEEAYMETADEEIKKAAAKYNGKEKGEIEKLMEGKKQELKSTVSSSFFDFENDPDFIPVSINKESLVEQSIVTQEMRDRFTKEGQFCFRIPGTWERDGQQEKILLVPRLHVFEADEGKTYIAFLNKRHLPLVLNATDGSAAMEYFGMSMKDFAQETFKEMGEAEITPERLIDPAKSLAETATIHLRQPAPPIKMR